LPQPRRSHPEIHSRRSCKDGSPGANGSADANGTERVVVMTENPPPRLPNDGRTDAFDRQLAIHEASHAVVMRYVSGQPLEGATVEPGDGFAGRVWGEKSHVAELTGLDVRNVAFVMDGYGYLPKPGQSNAHLTDIFLDSFNRCIGVVAGWVGERLFMPEGKRCVAISDEMKAEAYSKLICKSDTGANYLRLACEAEAERILLENEDAVMALAAALRAERTLDGEQIDTVIQQVADERAHREAIARRERWREVVASAASTSTQ
jgi:hypothetical protein